MLKTSMRQRQRTTTMTTYRISTIPYATAQYLMMLPSVLGGYVLNHPHSDILTSRYLAKLNNSLSPQAGERPVEQSEAAEMLGALDKWAARRNEKGVYGEIAKEIEGMDKLVRADLTALAQ